MLNFSYWNPTRIIFGKESIADVGQESAKWGKRVLFHFGGGSIKANGVYDAVTNSLKEAGLEVIYLGGVVPNPHLSLVRQGIALCKKEKIDLVLAVGGGSVIDSAKAIAFGTKLQGNEDVWNDYFMRAQYEIQDALPVGVVLTIPAAGSESSTASVITDEKEGLKRAINSETVIPKFAVMDPETNYSLPNYQTACGATDILAHLQERYFTMVGGNDLSDRLLESCMRNIIANAPLALKNPSEYVYRAELMWTGTIAHNNLLDRGRLGDWATHDIEHELSALYDIAHGAGLAILFPAWMKYVYKDNIDRFVQYAIRVWDVSLPLEDKDSIVEEAINRLQNFYRRIGMPTSLTEAKIGKDKLRFMAEKALFGERTHLGNFKKLYVDDVEKIYHLAL
ncbi:MAG TPA: NADH-dependent alcohol dehydrogenase [Sphaerochaeta sp.]|jgi:alcohol dehydrogenase YqhD (iron-dependent ADH family)|nr:MAG: butanol dehydrogenase [Spirochaetes bacterium GWC2_52_13]OHD62679.1 MAG: butanol dehydrogenase [Spirochaetes bacterium GWF2_52_7]HCG64970.1 NADH-dependent alcohol dehydrogenase [Sphaerochaeta sp.]HCJ93835.1 NADH-dependent alcohol dehydrogenase [Sphaerochaeta sp.]HCS37906.1 NADH-dependent alcohol dehydrogenase [Sphaerochaeta sp.]